MKFLFFTLVLHVVDPAASAEVAALMIQEGLACVCLVGQR